MDGRGRLAQPVKRSAGARAGGARAPRKSSSAPVSDWRLLLAAGFARLDQLALRLAGRVVKFKPRYFGVSACVLMLAGAVGYGVVKGEHVPAIVGALKDAGDTAANAAGFRITSLAIAGRSQLSEAEVLAAAGITANTSLLLLDVEATRLRLEALPWIAQASVRKLYPGRLEITIDERHAFAVWQKAGKLHLIAADGAVLEPLGLREVPALPLVVGPGAAAKAREFLELVDRYPTIRGELRAAVLVADRRWNLKLKSGLDVRLPETGIADAMDRLVTLDREKKLLSRDITAVDLRLPDRVSVRLSDEAAQAREQAAKDKKKRKGGDA